MDNEKSENQDVRMTVKEVMDFLSDETKSIEDLPENVQKSVKGIRGWNKQLKEINALASEVARPKSIFGDKNPMLEALKGFKEIEDKLSSPSVSKLLEEQKTLSEKLLEFGIKNGSLATQFKKSLPDSKYRYNHWESLAGSKEKTSVNSLWSELDRKSNISASISYKDFVKKNNELVDKLEKVSKGIDEIAKQEDKKRFDELSDERTRITLSINKDMLDDIKVLSKRNSLPYQSYINHLIAKSLQAEDFDHVKSLVKSVESLTNQLEKAKRENQALKEELEQERVSCESWENLYKEKDPEGHQDILAIRDYCLTEEELELNKNMQKEGL